MHFILQPWQLFFLILAGWVNRQQQEVNEYLRTENQVLHEKLGKKRILLNDDQRRRLDGCLTNKQHVIMDRDANFSCAFRAILADAGIQPLRLPPKSPNFNAHLERFHLSLKNECLTRMIFFGKDSLRRATHSFLKHYHEERNHQGLDNQLIDPGDSTGAIAGNIECRERLGGLLRYYHRTAA